MQPICSLSKNAQKTGFAKMVVAILASNVVVGNGVWADEKRDNAYQDKTSSFKVKNIHVKPDYHEIAGWSLFGKAVKLKKDNLKKVTVELPETKLDLKLLGVIHSENTAGSIAIIETDDKQHKFYRIEEELPGNAKIESIERGKVTISRSGKSESLVLKKFDNQSKSVARYQEIRERRYARRDFDDRD